MLETEVETDGEGEDRVDRAEARRDGEDLEDSFAGPGLEPFGTAALGDHPDEGDDQHDQDEDERPRQNEGADIGQTGDEGDVPVRGDVGDIHGGGDSAERGPEREVQGVPFGWCDGSERETALEQEGDGIDALPVDACFKVQVTAGRLAGGAFLRDHVAHRSRIAGRSRRAPPRQVGRTRIESRPDGRS